ncbi:MAG: DUF6941 family protein [Longimicrobiales bacterium]
MELKLAAICDEVNERADGRIDLIGVYDELSAPGFPAIQEHMIVVFLLEWDDDEAGHQPLRADLLDERDRKVLTIEGHTDVAPRRDSGGRGAQTRLILPLERVVFPSAGLYRFELVAAGDARSACSIHVAGEDPS